eukprot:TRINITY_DN2053_c0_g1_i4.p2 TRINITY_DN2053_c0_g1~~TRINITY_DN2053_c0_g1_i4.p2  ORF type:complete len:183 (-),score=48.64 TRINITY_DN2053_c0_g1_i4:187-735(-)
MKSITDGVYKVGPKVPQDAASLIRDLLQVNPKMRPDISAIMDSPWFVRMIAEREPDNRPKYMMRRESAVLEERKRMQGEGKGLKRIMTSEKTYQIHGFLAEDSEIEEETINSICLSSEEDSKEDLAEEIFRELLYNYPSIEKGDKGLKKSRNGVGRKKMASVASFGFINNKKTLVNDIEKIL